MKERISIIASMIMMLVLGVSCSNSDDDIKNLGGAEPIFLAIDIQDVDGANLLNPEVKGNIFGNTTVVAEYEGGTYPVDWDYDFTVNSKKMGNLFQGLFCDAPYATVDGKPQKINSKNRLYFGGIKITENFDRTIVVKYPGRSHEIRVVNKWIKEKNGSKASTTIYVDGNMLDKSRNIVLK